MSIVQQKKKSFATRQADAKFVSFAIILYKWPHPQKKINLIHRPLQLLRKYIQNRPFISQHILWGNILSFTTTVFSSLPFLRILLCVPCYYVAGAFYRKTIQKCFGGCVVLLRIKVHAVMFTVSHIYVHVPTLYLLNIRNITQSSKSWENKFLGKMLMMMTSCHIW